MASAHLFEGELWVLNDPEGVTEWIGDGGDANAFADILERFPDCGAQAFEPFDGCRGVRHAPVSDGAARPRRAVRNQSELEASDRITDIERLIKIRLLLKHLTIPGLRLGE